MPFRKSLSRDNWEPSSRAQEIAQEWRLMQRRGGAVSFTESDA